MKFFLLIPMILTTMLFFHNCTAIKSGDVEFSGGQTVRERFGDIDCITFTEEGNSIDCLEVKNGLLGKLFYLLDKTDGVTKADTLFDKNDIEIPFTSEGLNSVDVIIDRGFASETYILAPQLAVPALPFSAGFEMGDGQFLRDISGKVLFEAFALDLRGFLILGDLEPGFYTIGLLSDDGSILDLDINNDGRLSSFINHDGYHSPALACSTEALYLDTNSKIPLRLRYYQGPRTTIAMTMVMKKVNSKAGSSVDPLCGHVAPDWYGAPTNSEDYRPDYRNSTFGELLSRDWFIIEQSNFLIPESL